MCGPPVRPKQTGVRQLQLYIKIDRAFMSFPSGHT